MTSFRSPLLRVALPALICATALALFAAPALGARLAYSLNYDADTATAIDTATNQVIGAPIPVGDGPYSNAITPDGHFMYVADEIAPYQVVVVDLNQGQPVGVPIPLPGAPGVVAISPDGSTVYVTDESNDQLVRISTTTNQAVGTPLKLGGSPWGVAFQPNGQFAYVADEENDTVEVVDTQTFQVVGQPIKVGESPEIISFTPDGKFAYVTNQDSDTVSVIDTQSRQVVATIPVGDEPWSVAVTPNGKFAAVSNYGAGTVSVIDTSARQPIGNPVKVGLEPYELAITPDGKRAYVAVYGEESETEPESVVAIDVEHVQRLATIPIKEGGPWQIAIAPDQSPIASFTHGAATAGSPTNFKTTGSTDSDGLISTYSWIFGDGKNATTAKAKISHNYRKAKTFTASLTLTDNEGCSITLVFTGRTASCSGSIAATGKVKVKAPNNFKFGKLTKDAATGIAKLKVKLPYAGTVRLSGKGAGAVKRHAGKAKTLSLTIRATGKAATALAGSGSVKLKVRVKFKPDNGPARTKVKSLTLVRG